MASVAFTPNLRRHLDVAALDTPAATVRDALEAAFAANPRLRGYLVYAHGRLRRHVAIFVNDRPVADRVKLTDALAPDDEVFVFQALSGG